MKRLLLALTAFSVFAVQAEPLQVAATPVPHAEILEFIKPSLKEQGVELMLKSSPTTYSPMCRLLKSAWTRTFPASTLLR